MRAATWFPTTDQARHPVRQAGLHRIEFDTYDTDWDGEAYRTVSGQNSNNSVRVTDEFLRAVETDGDWKLTARISGKTTKTMKARTLWDKIGYAAWASADPGIQFHTTINDWHTCPAGGEIRASNPCSEYMFLDDTACNLASLNLMQFREGATGRSTSLLRTCGAAVDHGARNLGADGAVPVQGNRASCPMTTARWAWASPTSAAC
jgi:ribonucleotide reductase alpha subunit